MKTTRRLLVLAAMMGYALVSFAGGRAPMSTTAIGHMCVTLLTPAAITQGQDLQFKDINLQTANGATAECDMSMGTIKVVGNKATYAVTVSNSSMGFSQNGRNVSVDHFSAVTSVDMNGESNIQIGGLMKVSDPLVLSTADFASPLAVTVNYN
jgi:hypothetical protein